MAFENMTTFMITIIALTAFILLTIIIYDLMTPEWSFLQMFEGLSDLSKLFIS